MPKVQQHTTAQLARYAQLAGDAARLADLAGTRLINALDEERHVQWKAEADGGRPSVVSDLDHEIERTLRAQLTRLHPTHAVVGEEQDDTWGDARGRADDEAYVWVVDPIDGTTNFVNGVPLYAVSIGVLHRGVPVAGAIWCASTHRLRAGVYHASHGSALFLDGRMVPSSRQSPPRRVVTEPGIASQWRALGDTRVLACAAIECAWAAAGVTRAAFLNRPRIWDVAAGVVLAAASECEVLEHRNGQWSPFTSFIHEARDDDVNMHALREWSRPLLMGRLGTDFALEARTVKSRA